MAKLAGKVALVTGGTSGIGLATAKCLVEEGAFVYMTGRREPELNAALRQIGANVVGVRGDVAELSDLDRLMVEIKKGKGHLDIVFANAGIAKFAAITDVTENLFDSMFDINVKGVLFTVRKALPLLKDGSSIVLTASIVGSKGLPNNTVYSATKAAVRSFARTLATDLRSRHIRVNAISPGSTNTPGFDGLISEVRQAHLDAIRNAVPLGRLAEPEEVARAVVFLASDDSSYITGIELFVDGGVAQV